MTKAIELYEYPTFSRINRMRADVSTLRRILKDTSDTLPESLGGTGMCYHLESWAEPVEHFIKQWPEFSGSVDYPVKSTVPDMDAETMYQHGKGHKWDRTTKYGAARRRLARFLISCFEQQIEAHESDDE